MVNGNKTMCAAKVRIDLEGLLTEPLPQQQSLYPLWSDKAKVGLILLPELSADYTLY